MHTLTRGNPKSRQSGFVLVTTLLFLPVFTLLILSGMATSRLESQMTNNQQFQMVALADAEMALREGEKDVDEIVGDDSPQSFTSDDDHYYLASNQIDPSGLDWPFTAKTLANGEKYVVEYLGGRTRLGESAAVGGGIHLSKAYLFRISAQAAMAKGSKRNVQSIYVTISAP
jgi:type II secretory pathway pseudopilin PulG